MRYVRDLVPFITLALGFLAILLIMVSLAHARSDFAAPDMSEYYESLKQPDNGYSCCGEGDAYFADETEECPVVGDECVLVAIITDTRPNKIVLKNGLTIYRRAVPVGTRVPVPRAKVRRHPIPNPTDHNVIFLNAANGAICWEPVSGN